MLRTANQRIAALVLVGGVVALVYLLWLSQAKHLDLIGAWLSSTLYFLSGISEQEFTRPSPALADIRLATAVMAMLALSYFSGWLLAIRILFMGQNNVRMLLKNRREGRGLRGFIAFHRISAVLIILGGAVAGGALVWYMDFCNLNIEWAWMTINGIVYDHLSVRVEPSSIHSVLQVRAAHLTMAALAFSYALSLALAVGTMLKEQRTTEQWPAAAAQAANPGPPSVQ